MECLIAEVQPNHCSSDTYLKIKASICELLSSVQLRSLRTIEIYVGHIAALIHDMPILLVDGMHSYVRSVMICLTLLNKSVKITCLYLIGWFIDYEQQFLRKKVKLSMYPEKYLASLGAVTCDIHNFTVTGIRRLGSHFTSRAFSKKRRNKTQWEGGGGGGMYSVK